MENKNNNNGMGGGFLLGILVGILLTLLITTKKGREILKELMDKVIQKISDIDESIEKAKKKEGVADEENDFVKPKPEEVKREIRYLAADSSSDNSGNVKDPKEKALEKNSYEKGSKQEKGNKRLFFRKM